MTVLEVGLVVLGLLIWSSGLVVILGSVVRNIIKVYFEEQYVLIKRIADEQLRPPARTWP